MDVRSLKFFIEVAREGNIGRAAAGLHLSSRTVTRQIQTLEEDMGVVLFSRSSAGVELTPAGETLLRHAHQIIASMDMAADHVRGIGQGRLNVGAYGTALFNIIPEIQQAFNRKYPGIEIVLHTMPLQQQLEALRQGRILIAFDRFITAAPDLQVELVAEEPHAVALPRGHQLANNRTAIHLSDFRGQPIISSTTRKPSSAFLSWFQPYGFSPSISSQRSHDILSGIALVAAGFGIIPVLVHMQSIPIPNVVYLPLLSDKKCTIDLHCAYCKNETSPLLAALLETVREYREAKFGLAA